MFKNVIKLQGRPGENNPGLANASKLHKAVKALSTGDTPGAIVLNPDDLITRKEAAEMLRVSGETLKRWGRAGKLETIRLSSRCIRYRRSAITALVEQARTGGSFATA